eukprot:7568812-Ditylum_brightwellii.AAC.1
MTSTSAVDNIQTNFPHPVLPKIVGKLNYEGLYELHKLMMENVSSVSTSLEGGNHGHLALVISPAMYQTTAGTTFLLPQNLGPVPVSTRQFMANVEIYLLKETHQMELQQFEKYYNMDKALK